VSKISAKGFGRRLHHMLAVLRTCFKRGLQRLSETLYANRAFVIFASCVQKLVEALSIFVRRPALASDATSSHSAAGYVTCEPSTVANEVSSCACVLVALMMSSTAMPRACRASPISER
jgi:hypothetical protein